MPRRLKRIVAGDTVAIEVLPWPERNQRYLDWIGHVIAHEGGVVGLDVETTAIDDELGPFEPDAELRMVQFGSLNYGWCLDPHDEFWRPVIEATLSMRKLRFVSHTNYDPLWTDREFGIDLQTEQHHTKAESFVLPERYNSTARGRSIDTFTMAALLWPGPRVPKDLKSLTAKLIDSGLVEAEAALHARFAEFEPRVPTGKTRKDGTPGMRKLTGKALTAWGFTNVPLDDEAFGSYGGLDAIYVRRLLDILSKLLVAKRLNRLSTREQRIARMATDIRIRGHRVDPEWTTTLLKEFETEFGAAHRRLESAFGFTPLSPKRGEWLAERGVIFTKFTPTGAPQITMPSASSAGTLPGLVARYESHEFFGPIFADLLTMGQHKNILTNLRIIVRAAAADGLTHAQIRTLAAITGRQSVVKPAMQTFKKNDPRLRGCYIARDGMVFVTADYDSQETRIAAAYSRDPKLLDIVLNGRNMHIVTGENLFGPAFDGKTSIYDPLSKRTHYDVAKVLDFAQTYNAGPGAIGDQLGMERQKKLGRNGQPMADERAFDMWLAWRETYQGFVDWSDRMGELRSVVNPWGRRIPVERGREYKNGNSMIQSTGRDLLGDALIRLDDAGWGRYVWLPIHDEIVLEVPEHLADEACEALETAMYAKLRGIELTATADIVGTRWGAKPEK